MTQKEIGAMAGVIFVFEAIILFAIPAILGAGWSLGKSLAAGIVSIDWLLWSLAWIFRIFLIVLSITAVVSFVAFIFQHALRFLKGLFEELLEAIHSGFKSITSVIGDLIDEVRVLSDKLSREAQEAATDAAVIGALGIACAAVAYLSTEDFLRELAVLKVVAVASLLCAALKVVMLIPVRTTQIISGALIVAIIFASALFANQKHPLYPFFQPNGFFMWFRTATPTRLIDVGVIVLLSGAFIFYPYSFERWKRIFRVRDAH